MTTKAEDGPAGRRDEPRQTDEQGREPNRANERAGTQRAADDRQRRIAEAAYYRAERRGFAPGYEDVDWRDAEKEIDAMDDTAAEKRPASRRAAPAAKRRPEDATS